MCSCYNNSSDKRYTCRGAQLALNSNHTSAGVVGFWQLRREICCAERTAWGKYGPITRGRQIPTQFIHFGFQITHTTSFCAFRSNISILRRNSSFCAFRSNIILRSNSDLKLDYVSCVWQATYSSTTFHNPNTWNV
jgi:hypothetical protein